MKKYGKYEKRPAEAPAKVPAKAPKVKNALLQTYFTSLLSLVLCVTMFLGTSYAWFTSEVHNTGNEIYIGTLDVELLKQIPDGDDADTEPDYASLSEKDAGGNNTTKLFDGRIRWEPGYTTIETVKVVNQGDLAFNYNLTFTNGKVNGEENNEMLIKAAQNFVVYVHAGAYAEGEEAPADFGAIQTSETWKPVMLEGEAATLADILQKGLPVFSGSITDVRGEKVTEPAVPGPDDSKAAESIYMIALHMKEGAAAEEIMGQKLSLNVKLVAYQNSSEKDEFGTGYDDGIVPVGTEEELTEALKNGGKIVLTENITAEKPVTIAGETEVELDLNGKTLTSSESTIEVDGSAKLVLRNGTVASDSYVMSLFGDGQIYAENVVFNGKDGFGMNGSKTTENSAAEFVDCEFHISSAYNAAYISAKGTYTFTDCVLEGGAGILIRSGNVVLDGCTVIANGYLGKDTSQPDIYVNSTNVTVSTTVKDGVAYWNNSTQEGSTGDCVVIIDNSGSGYDLQSVTIRNCTFRVKNTVTVGEKTVPTGYAVRYFDKGVTSDGKAALVFENNQDPDGNIIADGTLGYVYSYYPGK